MGLWKGLGAGAQALGMNTLSSYTDAYHGKITPGAIPALAGAGIGLGIGTVSSQGDMTSALIGAGVGFNAGALALPVLGAAGALGVKGLTTMYKNPVRTAGAFGGMASAGGIGAAIGSIAGPVGTAIGGGVGAIGGAIAGGVAPKAVGLTLGATGYGAAKVGAFLGKGAANSAMRKGNVIQKMLGGIVKVEPEKVRFDTKKNQLVTERARMRLSKRGTAVAGIAGTAMAMPLLINRGLDTVSDIKAGQNTGVQRATPSYINNAGANGDLVFAMHQNRRG